MSTFTWTGRALRAGLLTLVLLPLLAATIATADLAGAAPPRPAADRDGALDFTQAVVSDLFTFWDDLFAAADLTYAEPNVVVFELGERGETACGPLDELSFSFYCPEDATAYLAFDAIGHVQAEVGNFPAAVAAIALPISMDVIAQLVGPTFNVYQATTDLAVDAASCLTGVWSMHLVDQGVVDEADVEDAVAVLTAFRESAAAAYVEGIATADPTGCLWAMQPVG